MPAKGARIVQLSTACCCSRMRASADDNLLFCQRNFGAQAVGVRTAVSKACCVCTPAFDELLRAPKLDLRIPELHLIIGNGGLRSIAVGLGGIQSTRDVGVVQRRQQLPLRHPRPFVEETPVTRPVILAAIVARLPRGDIAAGVEYSRRTRGRLNRGSDLHLRLAVTESKRSHGKGSQQNNRDSGPKNALTNPRTIAFPIVNTQGRQVWPGCFLLRRHRGACSLNVEGLRQ